MPQIDNSLNLPIRPDSPWLAPLAGFSDLPFRLLCRSLGAAVTCSEMVSARGLVHSVDAKSSRGVTRDVTRDDYASDDIISYFTGGTGDLLATCKEDNPLVIQLFGSEPEIMAEAVNILKDVNYKWFDCNMGCSVPKVTKTGAGSAMLKDESNAINVAKHMVKAAGDKNVGCKIRLGWQLDKEIYLDFAKALEDVGVGWITLHPRSARQLFSGSIKEEALSLLVNRVSIPVIASGDLFTAKDALNRINNTGVSCVMFARGAMANPAIFTQFLDLLSGKDCSYEISASFLKEIIFKHIYYAKKVAESFKDEKRALRQVLKMRSVIPRYIKHLPGARSFRHDLVHSEDFNSFLQILENFFDELKGASSENYTS